MFGEYYLLTKNDIKSLEIDSEKEVIHSIIEVENKNQKIKNIEINSKEFDDKVIVKDDMIFLLNDDFVVYSKLKSEVDIFIKKKFNPVCVESSTIYRKNERFCKLQGLFGLDIFECPKNLILRPATDFGIFTLIKKTKIENENLPRIYYEMGKCYRLEDKFDSKLERPYCFTLPDIHVIVKDKIYETVKEHLIIYKEFLNKLKINYALCLRITKNEYNNNLENIKEIAKALNKDMFVNIVPSSIKYWESKFKLIALNGKKEVQLSTVQVDYISSKIFDFYGENNENLTVIHSSPGSIERLFIFKKQN